MFHSSGWMHELLWNTQMAVWHVTLSRWSLWCSTVGWGGCVPLCSMRVRVWGVNNCQNLSAGIIVLTPISVQLTPSTPLFLENTHTYTQANMRDASEVLNSRLFRAGFSPGGESWTEPRRKTREESPLFFCISIPLPFPHSLCVIHSPTHSL